MNKISIIIPAYNEEKLLGRCLNSVVALEIPKGCEKEIIVVNNGSTDRTKEIVQNFSDIKVVDEARKGTNRARQTGFFASSGDLVIYFDADNVVPKNWILTALEIFDKDCEVVAVSGPFFYEEISRAEQLVEQAISGIYFHLPNLLLRAFSRKGGVYLIGGNFAIKRWAFEKINGFDTSIAFYGDDADLTRRVMQIGKIRFTKKLRVVSSPRRYRGQGAGKTLAFYCANHLSTFIFKRPVSKNYDDIR